MTAWDLDGNDKVLDCGLVAMAHLILLVLGIDAHEAEVLAAWEAVTGSDQAKGIDRPASELAVLHYMRDIGMGGVRIAGWTQIDHADRAAVEKALADGGIYAFFMLPQSAQSEAVWTTIQGPFDGHFAAVIRLDGDNPVCVTWGNEQPMTWAFWAGCCQTAVIIHF